VTGKTSGRGGRRWWLVVAGALLVTASGGVAMAAVAPDEAARVVSALTGGSQTAVSAVGRLSAPGSGIRIARTDATHARERLEIPKLGLQLCVFAGSSEYALQHGVWLQKGSAVPGDKRNVVLAGHRIATVFSSLHTLKAGDAVTVYHLGKPYRYRVVRQFQTSPTDATILSQEVGDRLTLYTCIPRSSGDKRTVVVCVPTR
jgi:LPXTG-site transpeptidase (sortase) family protein